MKRYILSSSKMSGEVAFEYGSNGRLELVAGLSALDDQQFAYLIQRMPWTEELLHVLNEQLKKTGGSTIREETPEITFEAFWNRYAHKRNKLRAEKLWAKLSQTARFAAFKYIARYENLLGLEPWRSKAYPDTYLAEQRWEDEK